MEVALRPTFDIDLAVSRDEAAHRLGAIVGAGDGPVVGHTVGAHLMLGLPPRQRRFWSPWLTIEIEPAADPDASRLRARFHPHPNVWTAFMLGYLAVAVALCFTLIFGAVQLSLKESPWALWIAGACAVVGVAMWIAARTGQGLAHDQMVILHDIVRRAVVDDEHPVVHDHT